MSLPDTTTAPATDFPVSDGLVVTLLGRTHATANDGQTITADGPTTLGEDVIDYARHIAYTEQARLPLTIVNQAAGIEAHAIVDPDGTVHEQPTPTNTTVDDPPAETAPIADEPPATATVDDPPAAAVSPVQDEYPTRPMPRYAPDPATPVVDPYPESATATATDDPYSPPDDPHHDDGYTGRAAAYPAAAYSDAPHSDAASAPAVAENLDSTPSMSAQTVAPGPMSAAPVRDDAVEAFIRDTTARRPPPPDTSHPADTTAPTPARPPRSTAAVTRWARSPIARRVAAVSVVVALAATGGYVIGHHSTATDARPLDTYAGSGPGDTTSGPGAIFALNYAEYVYPRTLDGVRAVWPSAPADKLGPYLGGLDEKTTHRLDITATSDPLTYTAGLTITPGQGAPKRFAQRYHLTRTNDGQYRVSEVTPAVATDDPITGTDAQPVAPTSSAAPTNSAVAPENTCPASTSGPVTTGNGPGSTSGAGVIEKFDYAYYVQRDATAAREVIDPSVRTQIAPTTGTPDRPSFDTSINSLPAGTTHCLKITDTGRDTPAGRRFTVALTESQPGTTPSLTNQTIYVKGAVITALTTNK